MAKGGRFVLTPGINSVVPPVSHARCLHPETLMSCSAQLESQHTVFRPDVQRFPKRIRCADWKPPSAINAGLYIAGPLQE